MNRTVLSVTGKDAERFLQDLVTNEIESMGQEAVYAALLTPQGKYLFDFFVLRDDAGFLVDVAADRAAALTQRLMMYRLRADIVISDSGIAVRQVVGAKPEKGRVVADPRHAALGWRVYGDGADSPDLTELRLRLEVPETGVELIADETYILEAGFERLNGVSFKKGCYVGQEVTARMKHKAELRKGLVRVRVSGAVPVGTAVLANGVEIGTLYSSAGGFGLAQLRLDRVSDEMRAGDAVVTMDGPPLSLG
jgi:tRNA-modifying protein YgfZ